MMNKKTNSIPNGPDELRGILRNCLELTSDEKKTAVLDGWLGKSCSYDDFEVTIRQDCYSPLCPPTGHPGSGFFKLDIYASSLSLNSDEVDIDNPLFSIEIRPHVWWINELKRLAETKRASESSPISPINV